MRIIPLRVFDPLLQTTPRSGFGELLWRHKKANQCCVQYFGELRSNAVRVVLGERCGPESCNLPSAQARRHREVVQEILAQRQGGRVILRQQSMLHSTGDLQEPCAGARLGFLER